ncbi:metal ABC transporter substrate-binding protein [Natronorarus salvus]|uniref:metal ABC transporter substrate-binding protein n=1 Tax=Natronorarus salvus TaxID=3117733 RepID=UPI002F25F23D
MDTDGGLSRRQVLSAGGGLFGAALAGCLDGNDNPSGSGDDGGEYSVAASFFMPYDVTQQIAGDHVALEDLVPAGEHGHDWDPDPGIVERIESADAFVYTRGFSSWQDDAADELEDDEEILVIEISDGITFIDSPAEENDEHFWMNPRIMRDGAENVLDGLVELDSDNQEAYEENAEAFIDELDAVHGEFQELADQRQQDQIIIGSHDSFQWWWDEYGFDIYSPVGISPDDEASAAELEEVERLVEEHGVKYILYDMLEPTNLAESLAEETGTEVLPLSPIEGVTEEMDEEWGYLEHQREINLETLELALEVE